MYEKEEKIQVWSEDKVELKNNKRECVCVGIELAVDKLHTDTHTDTKLSVAFPSLPVQDIRAQKCLTSPLSYHKARDATLSFVHHKHICLLYEQRAQWGGSTTTAFLITIIG